jgi:hypothetical protein
MDVIRVYFAARFVLDLNYIYHSKSAREISVLKPKMWLPVAIIAQEVQIMLIYVCS